MLEVGSDSRVLVICFGNRNDFYSTAWLNGNSLDKNSTTFFVLQSPIIEMYENQARTMQL